MTDPAQAKPRSKRWIAQLIFGLFVLVIIWGILTPGHGLQKSGYCLQSRNQMQNIAVMLAAYQQDHQGHLPGHLSELLPEYLDEPRVLYFSSPYTTSIRPADLSPNAALIDAYSPYGFGVLPNNRFYVFEKPGMWKDNRMGYYFIDGRRPYNTEYQNNRISPEEFEKRLLNRFETPLPPATTSPKESLPSAGN